MLFTNWRQDDPPAIQLELILLQFCFIVVVWKRTCSITEVCQSIVQVTNITCQDFCDGLLSSFFGLGQSGDLSPAVSSLFSKYCLRAQHIQSSFMVLGSSCSSHFPLPPILDSMPQPHRPCAFSLLGLWINSSLWLEHYSPPFLILSSLQNCYRLFSFKSELGHNNRSEPFTGNTSWRNSLPVSFQNTNYLPLSPCPLS